VRRLDTVALGSLLDRPTLRLAQLTQPSSQLSCDAAEDSAVAVVGRLRNPFSGGRHGARLRF
jgi:hypothetical protein